MLTLPQAINHLNRVDETSPATLFCDREGLVRYWNRSAERLFGYRERDIIGVSIDLLIPLRARVAHWGGYYRAMFKGCLADSRQRQLQIIHLDGREIATEATLTMLFDDAGVAQGVMVIFGADTDLNS